MELLKQLLEWGTDGHARTFTVGNVDVELRRDVGWDDNQTDQYHHLTTKVRSFQGVSFAKPGLTGSVKRNKQSNTWECDVNAQGFTADSPETPIILNGAGKGPSAEMAIKTALKNFVDTSSNTLSN